MDGYLSKPIEVNDLIATVERLGAGNAVAAGETAPGARDAVFDEERALAYTGRDRRLLKQVIGFFRSDSPVSLRRMERALRRRDGEALRMAAHAFKGSIATVGSPAGQQLAAELELMARSNQFEDAERVFGDLRDLVGRLDEAFIAAGLVSRSRRRPARTRPTPKKRRPS
jgi:HPt (histidine-containing phosphotransfer) domain-containing protein